MVLGPIPVILGPTRTKLEDVVPRLQLVREVAQEVAKRGLVLTGSLDEHDGVGIRIQETVPELVHGVVESESCPTGRELSHKDVEVGGIRVAVLLHFMVDFDPFLVEWTDPADIMLAGIQEGPKVLGIREFFDLEFVALVSKLAPHTV